MNDTGNSCHGRLGRDSEDSRAGRPWYVLLESAALACILAVLVARPFVMETPFRTSQLVFSAADNGQVSHKSPDELLRVAFAMVLLSAFVLWSIAQTLRRQWRPVGATFAVLLLVFSAWTFPGAVRAVDVRGALTGWFEQSTILLSALAMMQLVAGRKDRLGLVIVVLAALAGAMGAKAVMEAAYDIPQRIAAFHAEPVKQLAQVGITPGTPEAKMFEKRLCDSASLGYLGLSNVFASLLVVLVSAAGGLVVGKFAAARRSRRSARLERGEIHLPTLAAWVGLLAVVVAATAIVLTRSKGGIAAAAVAFVAAILVILRREFFARHRRKFLAACAAVILMGICAVAGWGKIRGSLPGWSMQVRWEYWVGSVDIIKENPVFGFGPGGFGDAYLRHRLPAAAESTKSPHNLIMEAAVQFGLVGAAVYLAMLAWIFIAVTRLRKGDDDLPKIAPIGIVSPIRWCIFLSLVVLVIRAVWMDSTNPAVLVLEALIPACVFGACLLSAMWIGSAPGGADLAGRYARIAVACGLAGFVLHNLISYSLWMPATATVFWITAGAMAGGAGFVKSRRLPGVIGWPVVVLSVSAVVAAGVWLWRPVFNRTLHVRAAQTAYSGGQVHLAAEEMKLAIAADPLDAFAPADLARLYAAAGKPEKAVEYADQTRRMSPTAGHIRLLARLLGRRQPRPGRALIVAGRAVSLDPMNMWFRLEYAEMLLSAGQFDAAAWEIQEVRRINRTRPAISDLRLTDEELKKLDLLEEEIKRRRTGGG